MQNNPDSPLSRLRPRGRRSRQLLAVLAVSCLLGVIVGHAAAPDGGSGAQATGILAPEAVAAAEPAPFLSDSLSTSMTGVWVTMGVFVVLAVSVMVVFRNGRRFKPGNGSIHVVDTVPLGGRRMIHLIRCGDRKYLVGNSERGLTYLASVPPDAAEREVDFHFEEDQGELPFERVLAGGGRGR